MGSTVVLLGPPGVGKGTQASRISHRASAEHLSTGDLFRAQRRAGTMLGRRVERYMDAGELIPDDLVLAVVRNRLLELGPSSPVIFDGFPRTLVQAEGLDAVLSEVGRELDRVLALEAEDSLLVERLSGRRTCPSCGLVFHVVANPPRRAGTCDRCCSKLETRPDDDEDTVSRRLEVYRAQTIPLINYYRGHRAGLIPVDASQAVDDVTEALRSVLGLVEVRVPAGGLPS